MNIAIIGNGFKKEIQQVFTNDTITIKTNTNKLNDFDIVFALDPNIELTGLKSKYQKIMLIGITKGKSFFQKVQYTILNKMNLGFILENNQIIITDPLGNLWYEGNNKLDAIQSSKDRLTYLKTITRKSTFEDDKNLILNWYFNSFKLDEKQVNGALTETIDPLFLQIIQGYSKQIYPMMGADLSKDKHPKIRCAKTMPSFRQNHKIYVSKRETPYTFLEKEDFTETELINDIIYYKGKQKPAVDTPIHIKIYEYLPQINFIIHTHTYIQGAPMTSISNPCGSIEEFNEIKRVIIEHYQDTTLNQYTFNLKGHGSMVLGHTLPDVQNIQYVARQIPEKM